LFGTTPQSKGERGEEKLREKAVPKMSTGKFQGQPRMKGEKKRTCSCEKKRLYPGGKNLEGWSSNYRQTRTGKKIESQRQHL